MGLNMQEIRGMAEDVLHEEIDARRARLYHARFEAKAERHENAVIVRTARREIAQMLTVLSERKLVAEKEKVSEISKDAQVAQE